MLVDGSGIRRRATGAEFAIGPPDLSYWAATHLPATECHCTGSYLVVRVQSSGPILTIDRTVFELWLGSADGNSGR